MGRLIKSVQTNFTSGELDPLLAGRHDLKHYYNGAEKLRNAQVIPQGGAHRRPGLEDIDAVARQITRVATGITPTAPNGGTAANANDDDESTAATTTASIGTTDPYVVVHFDLGSAKTIKFADVRGLKVSTGSSDEFRIQYSTDNVAWNDVGAAFDSVSTTAINRRRRADQSAQYWRVAKVGGTSLAATAEVLDFNLYEESATLSETREIRFSFSITQRYLLVVSDRNIAVYRDDTLQADISIPHTSAQLAEMNWTQSLDTLLLFHESVEIRVIQRQGAHDEWNDDTLSLTNAPVRDFGAYDTTGNTITLSAKTVGTGVTATASSSIFTSAMVGWVIRNSDDAGWSRITGYTSGTVVTVENREEYPTTTVAYWSLQEPLWSTTRGWPRCGSFHEGRLWMGGSLDAPGTIAGSRVSLFFDFDEGQGRADEAIIITLDTDDVSSIYNIFSGRHLQLFTSTGEFYVLPNDDPITPETIAIKQSSRIGSEGPGIRVASVEGATLFLQRGGKAVREYLFTDTEAAYSAQNISLLSSHLIRTPVDLALRAATSTDEGDLLCLVNSDGTLTLLQTLRSQEITAWTLHETEGNFKSVAAIGEDIYFVIERTLNGTTVRRLEKFNDLLYVDSGRIYTSGLPTATFTGLDHLDGEACRVRADDAVLTDVTPASGSATIERNATTSCQIGLDFPDLTGNGDGVWIKDMPVEPDLASGTIVGKLRRVVEAIINLSATQGFFFRANGGTVRDITFRKLGSSLLDEPPTIFTGDWKIEGLLDFDEYGQIEITQRDPVPCTITRIVKKVSV